MITVGINGDFSSVNDAVQAARSGDTIFVSNGIYRERVEVTKPNITLIGENKKTSNSIVITSSFQSYQIQSP